VLRGQEHLINTPKHVALQHALGFATPRYAHMPVIFNMDGSKMSKRDKEAALKKGQPPPEIDVHDFRLAGYLPEAVVNFIALLGWSPGEDREHLDVGELIALFSIDRVGRTNARFDREKLVAFNTVWGARLDPARLLAAFRDYLAVNDSSIRHADDATLSRMLKVCEGFRTFRDVESKTRFLFISDDAVTYEPNAVKQVLEKSDGAGYAMLEHLLPKFESLGEWTAAALHAVLEGTCQERGTKLGNVAQPVRVAVTGTTISPPIYDSLELLGKPRTLARLRLCLAKRA